MLFYELYFIIPYLTNLFIITGKFKIEFDKLFQFKVVQVFNKIVGGAEFYRDLAQSCSSDPCREKNCQNKRKENW